MVSEEDMKSLNRMIESMNATVKHLDIIIEIAQRQKISVVESRDFLKAQFEKARQHKNLGLKSVDVPIGVVILGGKKLIEVTEKLLDAGIKKVEENNKEIEKYLEIQKEEKKALEERIPRK